MATSIFQKFLQLGKIAGLDRRKIKQAREWFRSAVGLVKDVNANEFMRADTTKLLPTRQITNQSCGRMHMFFYDPKTKQQLPYYDRFPLVFPLQPYFRTKSGKIRRDGFLGINLHYLSPADRAQLMDALYRNLVGTKDEMKRLAITYDILKSAAAYKYFKPCVKVYLYGHVRSKYMLIPYKEWEIVLYLPLERFEKASKSKVWRESRNKVNARPKAKKQ